MNEIPENETPEQLLQRHRKYFEAIGQFSCPVCMRPRKKEELSRISLFRPAKLYKMARMTTYALCVECEKLTPAEIYKGVEKWMIERGHIEL